MVRADETGAAVQVISEAKFKFVGTVSGFTLVEEAGGEENEESTRGATLLENGAEARMAGVARDPNGCMRVEVGILAYPAYRLF